MKRTIHALLWGISIILLTSFWVSEAASLIEYQAPADPTTAGFRAIVAVGPAPQVNEPIANDLGFPAWSISGLGLSSQFAYSFGTLSAEQKADLASEGFTLTLRGRVLQGNAPAYDAGFNTVIGGAIVDTGSKRYDLFLGINSSGNTVAVLITEFDAFGPGGSIRGFGPSYTLNDAGYHTYELIFNPQTQSASLFIDGAEGISGYTGHTQFLIGEPRFGAISGGGMNFNLVRLASPNALYDAHSDLNIIDATHGFGAGSFELGTFVNGGGITYGRGPDYMGVAPGDGTTIMGWTVGGPGDGVDWLTLPTFGADTGIHAVDLQHISSSSIATVVPTVAGNVYELSFNAATVFGWSNTGAVSAGSLVDQPFSAEFSSATSTQIYKPFTFTFTATGPTTTIKFTATDEPPSTAYGPVIDSVRVVATELFGPPTLKIDPRYEFSLEQSAQKTESIRLVNTGDVSRSATLKIVNPHSEQSEQLVVSLQSQNPVTIAPGTTENVPLVIDATSAAVAVHEGILLEVAMDDGSTLYSNITVYVTELGAADLPDLTVSAGDISFSSTDPGDPVTYVATIHNRGNSPATNVTVQFYDFGELLGETFIPVVSANGSRTTSITVSAPSPGDRIIEVVIDSAEEISELDETNNEASQIGQPGGSSGVTAGNILVTGNLPPKVCAQSLFAVTGHAVYDITVGGIRNTDYVVKGGSVQVTADWSTLHGDIYTDVNGDFRRFLLAPASSGTHSITMTVTDNTFSGTGNFVFEVVECETEIPPPVCPPTCPPISIETDGGEWVFDPIRNLWEWICSGDNCPPIPAQDVFVYSEHIAFSNNHPDPNEEITIGAQIQYFATRTDLLAEQVPVNLYVTAPGVSRITLLQTVIDSMRVGGSAVYTNWKPATDGIYIVEIEIDPSYVEQNMRNNAATRAIIVGQYESGRGVISGQVTDALGGVGGVPIQVSDATGTLGSTVTDAKGFYLVENVLVGDYDVQIVAPAGYVADAGLKAASVTDQSVSTVYFVLTEQAEEDPIPGDLNGDGVLDFNTDFQVFMSLFGKPVNPPGTEPDYDGDGFVGLADYSNFLSFFNTPG